MTRRSVAVLQRRTTASFRTFFLAETIRMNTAETSPKARLRRKSARPAELLAAAFDVFVERGYAASRMDDIAKRAGVSKGTVFLYYESKQSLFRAVVEAAVVPHLEAGEALLARDKAEPEALMRALFAGYWRVLGDPRLSGIPKLVMAEVGNFPEVATYYHEQVVLRGRAMFAEIYQRGVNAGVFHEADPAVMCQLALAPLLFVCVWRTSLGVCDPGELDLDVYVQTHVEMFMRGLKPALPVRSDS
jgi:AcrR family transcriptional regulator